MSNNILFKVGEIVEILMGRDSGKFAVIIKNVNERYVLIVDGDKRKVDTPKKKNVRHIRSTGYISKEITKSLEENQKVSNAKLRFVLQDFISNHLNKEGEKGE